MRELTIDEMSVVTGAADSNKPVSSSDFKGGLIGWAVAEGMDLTQQQIEAYVQAYNADGIKGVLSAAPGTKLLTIVTGFINSLTSETPETPEEDGNNYCEDGGGYS